MARFRLKPRIEAAEAACEELAALFSTGAEEEVLQATVEIFRKGERVRTDADGRLPFQSLFITSPSELDYADIPIKTLVRLDEPVRLLKGYLSNHEYEDAIIRVYKCASWGTAPHKQSLDALTELGSLKGSSPK
jgi:hypothetical protein